MKKDNQISEIIIYEGNNGQPRIKVHIENETVWLTQTQLAELFGTTKQNISLHIQNIYEEGELSRVATVKEYLTVQKEGDREVSRQIEHYNLWKADGELKPDTVVWNFRTTATDGKIYENVACRNFRRTTEHGAIRGETQEVSVI